MGFEPVVSYESADLLVHHALALGGLAAAFLPDMVFRSPTAPLRDPQHRCPWPSNLEDEMYRDVYVITRRGGLTRPAVAALQQHIREVASA